MRYLKLDFLTSNLKSKTNYKNMKYNLVLFFSFLFVASTYSQNCSTDNIHELVRNGDFEAGYLTKNILNTNQHSFTDGGDFDFYSDANFIGDLPSDFEDNCEAATAGSTFSGNYVVAKAENFNCGAGDYTDRVYFALNLEGADNFKDHTPGNAGKGFALIVDPWSTPTKSGRSILWEQKIAVQENQLYSFSTWAGHYERTNAALLHLAVVPCVNGLGVEGSKETLSSSTPDSTVMQWTQLTGQWNSNTGVDSVFIRIEFDYFGALGAEVVALDDISFSNTCANIDSSVANHFYINSDTIELCAAGGLAELKIRNENGTDYSVGGGQSISWYTGTGILQTKLDSIDNNSAPIFTTEGDFRACISDPINHCAINHKVHIKQALDLGLSDMEFCDSYTINLTTPVKDGTISNTTPTWTLPSGEQVTAFEIEATKTGTYGITTGRLGSYKCKKGTSFTIGTNIPQPKTDTVLYCTNVEYHLKGESPDGSDYIWAYDSLMNHIVDTGSFVYLPDTAPDLFYVYFKETAVDSVGILTNDTSGFNSAGITAEETIVVEQEGIVLKELYVKHSPWAYNCSGIGKLSDDYFIIDGPVYDSIQFNITCGYFSKIEINKELPVGTYKLRMTGNDSRYYGKIGSSEVIEGVVSEQEESKNYSPEIFAMKKFMKKNTCLPGRFLAYGQFCDYTGIEDELNVYDFNLYPNPASEIISFNEELNEVSVFNSTGVLVKTASKASSIDVQDLSTGVYFVQSNNTVKKFIKK